MKKLIASVLAVSALAAAAPTMAQGYYGGDYNDRDTYRGYERYDRGYGWQSINQRQDNLFRRIERGVRNGQLTRGEAHRLRGEFRYIADLEYRYRRTGGLSPWERRDLDARFDRLSHRIRWERHDREDRRDGYYRY